MTVNNMLERILQEPSVTISTYHPRIYPEGLRNITKVLSHFVWCAYRDSNLGHPATRQDTPAVSTWSMIFTFFIWI